MFFERAYGFGVSSSECVNSQRGFWCLCSTNVFLCRKLEQEVEQIDLWACTIFFISHKIGKDLSSRNVDLISPPLPSSLCSLLLCLHPPPPNLLFSSPFRHPTNFACFSNTPFLSQRSFGWRTEWSSVKTPSSWCRTTRECWLWTSASQACLTGADTPAEPSMITGRMRWSALWRFEVSRANVTSHNTAVSEQDHDPQSGLTGFNKAPRDKSPSPQPLRLSCCCKTSTQFFFPC